MSENKVDFSMLAKGVQPITVCLSTATVAASFCFNMGLYGRLTLSIKELLNPNP